MLNELKVVTSYPGRDDKPLYVVRRDFSGGVNSRMHASSIADNQVSVLKNADISTIGEVNKRLGSVQIADDVSNNSVNHLHNYIRQGYTDDLLMIESNDIYANENEASSWTWVTSATASADVWGSVQAKESGLVPDDIVIIQNGTDNPLRLHKDSSENWAIQDLGTTTGASGSCPKSNVMCWYGNRIWVLKNDILYFSDAYDSDYSSAFDTVSNAFRVPVGEERGLAPTRDAGIVVMGKEAIWGLAPSAVPVATDKPEPLVTDRGVVGKHAWSIVGDDIHFFSSDGHRSLKRTIQDKLQLGGSPYPLSYGLKDEFDKINFAYADRIRMQYFDSKLFIVVPTSASTFDTWVYFTASNSYMILVGWNPRCLATYKINGSDRIYYGKHGNGVVYRGWYGYTDEGTTTSDGTAITETLDGREENLGQPLVYKNGGELEIESEVAGSGNSLTVNVSLDGGNFQNLGTVSLTSSTAPILPISLPFSLSDSYTVREKFHLDSLGRFRTIKVEVINSDVNTDPIKLYGYNLMTFAEEYENE